MDASNQLILLAELSIATAVASLTLTRARIFAPWRQWVKEKNAWLGELAGCPYCTCHWVAAILTIAARWPGRLPDREMAISGLLLWLTVVGLASVAAKSIFLAIVIVSSTEEQKAETEDYVETSVN